MASSINENWNFVLLIEKNKDVLEKSQEPSAKKKKDVAAMLLIEKWHEMCGTRLTHLSLLKKINNLKNRAKNASKKGGPVKPWQSKILQLTQDNLDEENSEIRDAVEAIKEPERHETEENAYLEIEVISGPEQLQSKSEIFSSQFESDETKSLSNDQLQRIVFLQQMKVLELQKKKLELEVNAESNPILLDISGLTGLNVSNILNDN